ncbi:MAG: hypothetical protein MUC48_05740 [Leptolyngbya sp. Prado105]|jgi:hypothetical protein|nr:hypothetical protein [Leptolyngbya sp. Prado105]
MKRYLISLTAVFALACNLNSSASAIPGDSVQTVKNWAKQHSLLSPLNRGIAELSGLPFYTSQAKLPNGTVVFSMSPDRQDKISQRETIAFATAQAFPGFTRQNLDVIRQIFNRRIVSDFRASRYVAKVDYAFVENRYFRGSQFAYQTATFKQAQNGQKFYHFTVIPLKDLEAIIQGDRQCRSRSANGCE